MSDRTRTRRLPSRPGVPAVRHTLALLRALARQPGAVPAAAVHDHAGRHTAAAAYPDFLHRYDHHRGQTALGGQPPAARVTNLAGQYT